MTIELRVKQRVLHGAPMKLFPFLLLIVYALSAAGPSIEGKWVWEKEDYVRTRLPRAHIFRVPEASQGLCRTHFGRQQPFWYAVSKDERIEYACARVLRDVRSHWVRVDMLPKIQV